MSKNLYLSHPGVICAAGKNPEELWESCLNGSQNGIKKVTAVSGKDFYAGRIDDPLLSPVQHAKYDMRIIRILKNAVDQIMPPVKKAVETIHMALGNLEISQNTGRTWEKRFSGLVNAIEEIDTLKERYRQVAGTLSGGEQQMLAMGRALMSRPKLMMLDEPSMGLAPILVQQIFDIIVDMNKQGTTILLVEQNAQMALSIANRADVLETGRITTSGTGDELLASEAIQEAYLGKTSKG